MPGPSHFQLLDRIARLGPMTRAALGAELGLGKAAISGLTRDLLDQGLICAADQISGPGRPSTLLALAAEGAFFIGISLLSDPARLMIVDFFGNPRAEADIPRGIAPDALVQNIASALPPLINAAGIDQTRLFAMSVTLSAHVDRAQKLCLRSTLLNWTNIPLAKMLEDATGITTHIENDAKAMVTAESLNMAETTGSLSLIWLDEGIGAAHFLDGKLWRGAKGAAGEIAHLVADPAGLPCSCGRRGCLDTVASTEALAARAAAVGLPKNLQALELLAQDGNSDAIAILGTAAKVLGQAMLLNHRLLDPAQVLLVYSDPALSGHFASIVRRSVEDIPLTLRQIGPSDWALAAARLATHNYLKNMA